MRQRPKKPVIHLRLALAAVAITATFCIASQSRADCSYAPDPWGDSSGYEAWCSNCWNGYVDYSSGVECIPGDSGGGSGGYYDPEPYVDWEAIERQQEEERRRLEEEARLRRILGDLEIKIEANKQAAREQWEHDKQESADTLKGTADTTFDLKSGGEEINLEIKGIDAAATPRGDFTAGDRQVWKQLHCGSWIAAYSFPAAERGDIEEVRYLGDEVVKALQGNPVGLACPPAPEPPAPYGHLELEGRAPLVLFYQQVTKIAKTQAGRINDADTTVADASRSRIESETRIRELEEQIARLDAEQAAQPDPAGAPRIEPADVASLAPEAGVISPNPAAEEGEENAEKKSFSVADLIGELAREKDKARAAAGAIEKANRERDDAVATLGALEAVANQVEANPDLAGDVMQQFAGAEEE